MDSRSDNHGSLGEDPNVALTGAGIGECSLEFGAGDSSTSRQDANECMQKLADDLSKINIHKGADYVAGSVAKLIQSRMEDLTQKRVARRAAWLEQARKYLEKRREYNRELEGAPLNPVLDKDKQRISNASREWRKTLQNERAKFLFSDVLPLLCKYEFRNVATSDKVSNAVISLIVLRCRLVCSSWRESIDALISLHNATNTPFTDGIPYCPPKLVRLDKLTSFNLWSDLTYRGRNPFFTRQFTGGSEEPGSNLGYWNEVVKMLRRWGGELWSVNLNFVFDKGSLEMMYIFLYKILSLTPNLRRLSFLDRDGTTLTKEEVRMRMELARAGFATLKSRMERTPLPDLPYLRSIVFGGGAFAPGSLVQALLYKYGDVLTAFEFLGVGPEMLTGGYVDPGQFISARPLPLQKYSCQYGYSPKISHWSYQFPFLKELSLYYFDVHEGAEVGNIFKTVNSCGSTLRRLLLLFSFNSLPSPVWRDHLPPGLKLELPHLDELDLYVIQSKITNIDFLLPLVSLKELSFSHDAMRGDDSLKNGKGIIQFAGFRDRLYDSNIWQLLPELKQAAIKTVRVVKEGPDMRQKLKAKKTIVYNREGYQRQLI